MMMIFILIIITQENPHKKDISCKNQNKPLTTIKLERKRNSDGHSPFPPHSPTPLFTHSLHLSHSFSPTDIGNMCKCVMQTYVYMYARATAHTQT